MSELGRIIKKMRVAEKAAEDRGTGDMWRDWWVVLFNPLRQPPVPKFHTGHLTRESAEARARDCQVAENQRFTQQSIAMGRTISPPKFFVIARPSDDEIERHFGVTRPVTTG